MTKLVRTRHWRQFRVEMITEALPVILAPGEGETLHAFGEQVTVHLSGAQTGGRITLWTEITPLKR